jgi:hypothetical protein
MKRATLLLCSVLFLAVSAFGSVAVSIAGRVTDPTASVVPGAKLWL